MNTYYAQLSVDELAADPAVKAFVLEGNLDTVWDAWLEEHPEQAVKMMKVQRILRQQEVEVVQSKPKTPPFTEATSTKVSANEAQSSIGKESAQTTTEVAEKEAPLKKEASGIRGWVQNKQWGRVAALALAALGVLYYLYMLQLGGDLYRTEAGEIRIVELPDGSKVHMAPVSTLRVKDAPGKRDLNLLGEAFFEVKKGTPLTVNTSVGEVTVLGTSFSISASESLAVACATGSVNVTRKADDVTLSPGFAVASIPAGLGQATPTPIEAIAAWRNGRLLIKDQSVAGFLKRFERYYPRGFKVDRNLLNTRLNLELPTHDFPLAIERINFGLQTQVDTSLLMIGRG